MPAGKPPTLTSSRLAILSVMCRRPEALGGTSLVRSRIDLQNASDEARDGVRPANSHDQARLRESVGIQAQEQDRERPRGGGHAPREEVERLFAKERYKDAVKQAKLCYRDEPTPEHHRLLERAYLLRAQQLRQGGMTNAAQEVAHHLVEFKVTDPELVGPAAELLVAVGLSGKAMELQRAAGGAGGEGSPAPPGGRPGGPAPGSGAGLAAGAPRGGRAGSARRWTPWRAATRSGRGRAWPTWRGAPPSPSGGCSSAGSPPPAEDDPEERRAAWDRLDPARAPARIAGV